jgi:predicted nuclease with RNAse H fold
VIAPTVTSPTVIAIDWSGARRPVGIWLAVMRRGELVESRPVATREEAVDYVRQSAPPVVAGFDFSFGLPEWFAREHGCTTIDDVWALAEREGERWLSPSAPFWRTRCEVPPEQRFRRCETRFPTAKSVFQLVGNGQVGAGSLRGMPLLRGLRASGVAIWPFDAPAQRTAFEIYPSALRRLVPDRGPFTNEHERDAVSSAFAMWRYRETVAALNAATDPTTRLEGDVWAPTPAPD